MPAMMRQTTPIVWNAPDNDQLPGMNDSPHVSVCKSQQDNDHKKSTKDDQPPPVISITIPKKSRSSRSEEEKRDPLSRSHHRSSSRRRNHHKDGSASRSPRPGARSERSSSSRNLNQESRWSASPSSKDARRSERTNIDGLRKATSGSDLRSSRSSRHHKDEPSTGLKKASSGGDLRSSSGRLRKSRSSKNVQTSRSYQSLSSSKLDLLSRSTPGRRTRNLSSSQQNELFVLPPHLREPQEYTREDFKEACKRQGTSPPRKSSDKDETRERERSLLMDKPQRSKAREELAQSDRGGRRSRTIESDEKGKSRSLSRGRRSRRLGKGELSLSDHRGKQKYLRSATKELLLASPLPPTNGSRRCPKGSKHELQPEPLTLKPTFRSHQAKGRNPMIAKLEADYKQAHQEKTLSAKAIALKDQIEKAKTQWVNLRTDTSAEIAAMRREFAEKKQAMLQDFAIRKQIMQQEAAVASSGSAVLPAALNQELQALQEENKALVEEIAEVAAQIREAQKEKFGVEQANREAKSMMKSLKVFIDKKTRDQEKLMATKSKLETIYNGSVALKLEPEVKKHYRRCIYKCLEGTHSADRYDHDVYMETLEMVKACEAELGCELLQPGSSPELEKSLPSPSNENFSINEGNASFAITDEAMDVSAFTQDADKQAAAFSNVSDVLHESQLITLYENKDMLVSMFKFLDKDGGGTIDLEEFTMGIDLLNRRLPESVHIQNPQQLFLALDVDRSGALDLEEFASFFAQSSSAEVCAQG